jgi:hypothetical protein
LIAFSTALVHMPHRWRQNLYNLSYDCYSDEHIQRFVDVLWMTVEIGARTARKIK